MIHRQGERGNGDDRNISTSDSGKRKGKAGKGSKSKKNLEVRFYEQDKWNKITAEENSKMLEMKKAKRMNRSKEKGSSKRKASAVEKEKDEDASGNEGDGDAEPNEQQAGNEFGRGAHKKKKVTISSTSTQNIPPKQAQRHVMVTRSCRFVMDSVQPDSQPSNEGRVELDTHADTCVAGSNTVVLDLTGKTVTVLPFCETEFDAIQDIPIATVGTAYDCPTTGRTYILVNNEALYFRDKMAHTLLCLNQLRHNGLRVDDCPRQYDAKSSQSISIPGSDLIIPLTLRGVISGFVTRLPTDNELDNVTLHVELTSDIDWDLYATKFSEQEIGQGDGGELQRVNSTMVT